MTQKHRKPREPSRGADLLDVVDAAFVVLILCGGLLILAPVVI